jgi:hypothetical protein
MKIDILAEYKLALLDSCWACTLKRYEKKEIRKSKPLHENPRPFILFLLSNSGSE